MKRLEEVFDREYRAPVTDGSGWPRANLLNALALLNEAGWVVRDMRLVDERTGEPMRFEILIVSPTFERIILPFVRNLNRLGIDARGRVVSVDPVGEADAEFLSAARRHLIRTWRYKPATEDGRPVATTITITLRFELRDV